MTNSKTQGTGLPKNSAAALSYVVLWLSGLFFLLMEKDPFVRFHALQSVVAFAILTVLMGSFGVMASIPLVGPILLIFKPIISLAGFAIWLVLIIKAYQGEKFKLPYIGDWAEEQAEKMS